MIYGVSIPFMHDPSAKDPLHKLYTFAELAEEAGFDFLSMGHHVFTPDYPTSAPLALLTALAARTSRIKLASVIYLLPLYHPVAVAEQVATLDLVSNGRAIFGIGIGYRAYEFEGFGVNPHHRGARTDEAMTAIRNAWTTGKFNFQGRHFKIPELPAVPTPTTKPHPPMWVGGVSKAAMTRAARLGDGWISANMQPLDDILEMANTYRALCAAAGKPSFVCISRDSWVSDTREEMIRDWYPLIVKRHVGFKKMGFEMSDPGSVHERLERGDTIEPMEFIKDRVIGGTPLDCIGQIQNWRKRTGAEAMLMLMNKSSTFEQVCRVIKLFGREVLPALRT